MLQVLWLQDSFYIQYLRPKKFHVKTNYLPYAPYIFLQECAQAKCKCILQKEVKYKALEQTINFTNAIYKPFDVYDCPLNQQVQSKYAITINQTCLVLTVFNFSIVPKSCTMQMFFNLT